MAEKIIILDFGSQYTQLIGRSLRELNVYCEILPFNKKIEITDDVRGFILSGSPFSVNESSPPEVNFSMFQNLPVLGICYGAQLMARTFGGEVQKSDKREYGRANLQIKENSLLFKDVRSGSDVWMSHSDSITQVPESFSITGYTSQIPVAAFESKKINVPYYGLQFHPEVYHSQEGRKILKNFLINICHCKCDWTPANFITDSISQIQDQSTDGDVVMALSGGVDSTVAAILIHKAIGKRLYCIFVDHGLLRKNEFEQVLHSYKDLGLNVKGIDAREDFYSTLKGHSDPETKRKIIGKTFIEIFDREAKLLKNIKFLGQGTIYPDVIESVSVHGPSATIKSHHNVGGLPEHMHLKLIEPLRMLFKDEVRKIGHELGIPPEILSRHPFPGPGLAIRILGDITPEKVEVLQKADNIFINELKKSGLYATVWQAGAILLPVKSVGVMGDERTYESTVALRAVTSVDGMTADWAKLDYDFLAKVSNEIINNVKGINRVVYDISSKPPATIEWE